MYKKDEGSFCKKPMCLVGIRNSPCMSSRYFLLQVMPRFMAKIYTHSLLLVANTWNPYLLKNNPVLACILYTEGTEGLPINFW